MQWSLHIRASIPQADASQAPLTSNKGHFLNRLLILTAPPKPPWLSPPREANLGGRGGRKEGNLSQRKPSAWWLSLSGSAATSPSRLRFLRRYVLLCSAARCPHQGPALPWPLIQLGRMDGSCEHSLSQRTLPSSGSQMQAARGTSRAGHGMWRPGQGGRGKPEAGDQR